MAGTQTMQVHGVKSVTVQAPKLIRVSPGSYAKQIVIEHDGGTLTLSLFAPGRDGHEALAFEASNEPQPEPDVFENGGHFCLF